MLIPDLALTPGLAERLRACGDEPLQVAMSLRFGVDVLRADGSELSEHEQRRVEGVLAAHRVEPF